MQRVYKTWKIFVKILLFSLGFYLLMLIPNALYDNTFAKGLGFLLTFDETVSSEFFYHYTQTE